jgi:beta-glucosidase
VQHALSPPFLTILAPPPSPSIQVTALAQAIVATGKPLVAVLYGDGSALSSPYIQQHADAVLSTFVPGESNGDAVADVLLGTVAPGGALPVTVYTQEYAENVDFLDHSWRGQVDGIGRGDRYLTNRSYVMYPFGFSLGYSEFNVSVKSVSPKRVFATATASIDVNVSVRNVGAVVSSKVVQLMVREKGVGMPNRANRWLAGFSKVHDLAPGAARTLTISVGIEAWSGFDAFTSTWKARPGEYEAFLLQSCCPSCAGTACPECTCKEHAEKATDFEVLASP